MTQTVFTHRLQGNAKRMKLAFFTMLIVLILCIAGIIIADMYWDQFVTVKYSFRTQSNRNSGWPVALDTWSWRLGVAIILGLPFLYFMQDWKNPALAIGEKGLFINQQMIRNTMIPFSEIKSVEKTDKGYRILFHNPAAIAGKQFLLFRKFVRYNLENDNFFISGIFNTGDSEALFAVLEQKLSQSK